MPYWHKYCVNKAKNKTNMIIIKKIFILLLALGFYSCNKHLEFTTSLVSNTTIKPDLKKTFYSIPKTSVKVNLFYSRTERIAGPYAEYAKYFFGLNAIKLQNETLWEIDSVQIETFNESDPEMVFAVQSNIDFPNDKILRIGNEGFIYNPQNFFYNFNNLGTNTNSAPSFFSDLGPIPFQAEKNDTTYKIILKDSMFVRIPIVKPRLENKSTQDKAKEIAEIIYKLRQRKLELLLEEDFKNMESSSIKQIFDEISSIEDTYLSLFTGKNDKKSFKETYIFTPTTDYTKSYEALGFFSPVSGLRKTGSPDSKPVLLVIERTNKTAAIKTLLANQKLECKNQLIYRIPELTNISVTFNNETIRLIKSGISQFGALVSSQQ